MDNKRYLLALALSMGILLIWMQFVVPPPKPRPSAPSASPNAAGTAPEQPSTAQEDAPPLAKPPVPEAAPPSSPRTESAALEEKTVETDLYRVRLENRGGRILSWVLKKYQDDAGRPLELVSVAAAKLNCFPLDLELGDSKLTDAVRNAMFVTEISAGQDGS